MAPRRAAAKREAKPKGKPWNRPPPKPRPPRKSNKPRLPGASVGGKYNPLRSGVPPHMLAYGKYFPLNGMIRSDFTSHASQAIMYLVTCIPGSGTVGIKLQWPPGSAVFPTTNVFTVPLLATSGTSGGAASVKASKIGIELENTTTYLNTAGRVYVGDIDNRMLADGQPSTMIGTQLDVLAATIKAFPETKLFAARHFVEPKFTYAHVVDDVDYGVFDSNTGPKTVDQFGEHIMLWPAPSISTERSRPMSTLVVLVEPTPTLLQDYTLTMHAQHLTRWPLTTVPGQAMKDGKASDPLVVAKAREAASSSSVANTGTFLRR